ncbi:MAG TPA: DNA mismatch repair endonuclease MutL [Anaerolineales bacterium]|nr:DNA mismatch repair endonuclease MutL [Anaerolineales bacterium]HND93293.1 DNA mismatch repair endonuclease MutL [Anaerolineales bacterium]HNE68366.1 DNA mismatch repair endonuclease MutL [Anaerolineales bacterium]HNF35044.1 DNA mismatch repair endonuclease MutL [Anaerolineales bacterium]
MPIRLLSSEVASQIAAGEVVERPASVVKELTENALDAGAKSISISIEDAGRTLVEIADDGHGIPANELELAAARHATSKLVQSEDLFHIQTLGFRGEALASIGSVSHMTITSRVADAAEGARLKVDGGIAGKVEKVGAPVGTTLRVENLFYNVPARLKFLKTDVTERRAIDALVTRYALAYPNVRFKVTDGKQVTLQTAGDGDRRSILAALYGVDVAKQMLEVMAQDDGLSLTGFISPTSLTRSNRKEITFFVNGRWVQDYSLTTALLQAYHTLLMVGRYPLTTLFLEVDPEDVDVNVHPTKAEVRFRSQDKVFSFIQRSARKALLAYTPVASVSPQLWGGSKPASSEGREMGIDWSIGHDDELQVTGSKLQVENETSSSTQPANLPPSNVQPATFNTVPLLRLIGQIGSTYIVAEGPDGLYLIDQHAAHERVLFEKLMAQHDKKTIPSQALLTPEIVTLPPQSAKALMPQLPFLNHFGFEVEEFGANTFQVRAMPALFAGGDPASALRALVEDFEEDEAPLQSEVEAKLAARVCKRLAVKGGQTLTTEEQRALLNDLEACASPRTCPHGRPTMIHLSVDALERQFGRRGAR